jgi:hypothetical protein
MLNPNEVHEALLRVTNALVILQEANKQYNHLLLDLYERIAKIEQKLNIE